MALYCGIDFTAPTMADDRRAGIDAVSAQLSNDLAGTLAVHEPYRTELVAGAVESTFNWYWPVDRADNLALLRSKVRADCLDFARNATYEVG